jgi:hypothetical protein
VCIAPTDSAAGEGINPLEAYVELAGLSEEVDGRAMGWADGTSGSANPPAARGDERGVPISLEWIRSGRGGGVKVLITRLTFSSPLFGTSYYYPLFP